MAPKLNPNIKIELKEGTFALTDIESGQTKPIDPLAVFVCSLCDGSREVPDITTALQQKLNTTNQPIPEDINLRDSIQRVVDLLSQEGVLFIE